MKQCSVSDCSKQPVARGWCQSHYMRWKRRGGDPAEDRRTSAFRDKDRDPCGVGDCGSERYAKGLCRQHYDLTRNRQQEVEPRPCEMCGEMFTPVRGGLVCSQRCKGRKRTLSGRGYMGHKTWWLKTRYGITVEEYDMMKENQEGGCAICGRSEPGPSDRVSKHSDQYWLHVDHDHKTGQVRGLLCSECNTGLGKFHDNPDLIRAAMFYLDP